MELSTTIPKTTMRQASVIVLRGMPTAYIIPVDTNVLSGIVMAATMALRVGNRIIITKTIITMLNIRSRRKSWTESPTTFGKSVMRRMLTSAGRYSSLKFASTRSTSSPYFTMLCPEFISSERSTQRLPLFSIYCVEVSYSRRTSATSRTRTTRFSPSE